MARSRKSTRREFIRTVTAGGFVAAGAASVGPWFVRAAGRKGERPNILVIMSDEHDPAVTGCYGDKIVRTRHLDEIAGEGILFENFYTTSPLCVPARLSFTSGKYISRVGAWSNSCWLPSDDYPSLPRILNAAGYESFLGGKMHYDRTRRYGFRELYPSNMHFKTGKGRRRKPDDTSVNYASWRGRSSKFHTGPTSSVMQHDIAVTEHCSRFIMNRRPSDRPFFLLAGYLAPHFPLIVPEEYYRRYKGRIEMPVIPDGYLESLPLNYKHLRRGFGLIDTDPRVVKKGRELYWALTEWVDNEIGKLLSALSRSAVGENTMVIYTSDHGENKGDHGLWWKNCMFETAARVPLIISWPKRWKGGQSRKGPCSFVDLVQTIAEIAGAETPDDWDGDSMLAWLDDRETKWKDFAVSEYYGHNIASGFSMFRDKRYKYVYHNRMDDEHGPEYELYDLETDPKELHNLAGRKQYASRLEEMHKRLVKELGRDPDEIEQICRADYAKGYERRPARRKKAARTRG